MTSQVSPEKCPVCGAGLPANAPQGLCPKCLLIGVAAPTEPGTGIEERRPPPSVEAVQAAFPQLEVLELIGQGGMGAVFKARQPKLNRFVALKILPEGMSRQPAFAERFTREAQMLARLNHPNIVTIHDFGQAGEFFYLLMEYVEGVNLRQAMSVGRFTPQQALAIVPMICEALQYAHDEGVLHRDVKPENILLDTKGRVRLVDFGIAKLAAANDPPAPGAVERPADAALTQSGSALGTPNYMAPEQQLSPSTVDQRADIYSLGVVFYEMLTGELPVGRFTPPSRKTPVDPRVDDVVLRAMAKQKENRFASAEAVKTSVEAIATSRSMTIPAAAVGHPTPLSPWLKNVLLIEMVVLVALMAHEFLSAGAHMWQQVGFILRGGLQQASVALAGLGAIAWMGMAVLRRRDWLLRPFQSPGLWPCPKTGGSSSTRREEDWLRIACLAFIGVGALKILWILVGQAMLLAQAVSGGRFWLATSIVLPTGAVLLPAISAILLVVCFIHREVRRTDVGAPSKPPPWMPRAAVMVLALAIVTNLPLPQGEGRVVWSYSIGFGSFLAVTALALLTRSRIWRALALAILLQLVFINVAGLGFLGTLAANGRMEQSWSGSLGPFEPWITWIGTSFLSLFCYAAALAALLVPEAAAAFGIRRRHRTESPGGTATAAL